MKRLVVSFFILMCLSFSRAIASESKAPDFVFSDMQGKNSLYSLLKTNKVALLYFCDDSEKSWKKLAEANELFSEHRYRGSNLELLAFMPGKKAQELEKLSDEHWLNAELQEDFDGKITKSFNVRAYPTIMIVDPFGTIRFQGNETVSQEELRKKLNEYVDKPAVKAFCPVDKMWVVVTDKTPSVVYKGTRYYFCSSEDHDGRRMDQEFLQDPERYAREFRLHMKKKIASEPLEVQDVAAVYECPMKDFPEQKKPGICPKCGMKLEKKTR